MHIQDFPDTLMLLIFSFLSETDLCRVAQACRSWRFIAYDSSLWKSVSLKRFHKLNEMCLIKVIRSRMVPLLYKLNLGGFTLSPRVFHVLVKHCPRLKVLCLESATFVEDFMVKASIERLLREEIVDTRNVLSVKNLNMPYFIFRKKNYPKTNWSLLELKFHAI